MRHPDGLPYRGWANGGMGRTAWFLLYGYIDNTTGNHNEEATMTGANEWVATDETSVLGDIDRLGLDGAIEYQMELMADRTGSGDDRWDGITEADMRETLAGLLPAREGAMNPTNEQIANSFHLWGEYIDPDATMTEAEFDAMEVDERIELILEITA